jgi:hypothetical protein
MRREWPVKLEVGSVMHSDITSSHKSHKSELFFFKEKKGDGGEGRGGETRFRMVRPEKLRQLPFKFSPADLSICPFIPRGPGSNNWCSTNTRKRIFVRRIRRSILLHYSRERVFIQCSIFATYESGTPGRPMCAQYNLTGNHRWTPRAIRTRRICRLSSIIHSKCLSLMARNTSD